MQLRTITARYGRKRQPAQYESAEAMIEFTLSVDEDGQIGNLDIAHQNIGETLLGQAKTLVLRELGVVKPDESASVANRKTDSSTSSAAAGAPASESSGGRKRAKKGDSAPPDSASTQQTAPPAGQTQQPAAMAKANDIPLGEDPKAAKNETALGRQLPPAQTTAAASANPNAANAVPLDEDKSKGSPAQQQAASETALTHGAVQKAITGWLVHKKFLPDVVLGKLKQEYKVERITELSVEQLAKFYDEMKKLAGEG